MVDGEAAVAEIEAAAELRAAVDLLCGGTCGGGRGGGCGARERTKGQLRASGCAFIGRGGERVLRPEAMAINGHGGGGVGGLDCHQGRRL
jgi:hypothetical protein